MPAQLVDDLLQTTVRRLGEPAGLESFARLFNVSRDAMFYRLTSKGFYGWTTRNGSSPRFQRSRCRCRPAWPTWTSRCPLTSPRRRWTALYDADRVSAGKLAEWFFCSRPTLETDLSQRYFEAEALIV